MLVRVVLLLSEVAAGLEQNLVGPWVRPRHLLQAVRLDRHRPPGFRRRVDRHHTQTRVLTEVLLVPVEAELVLLRRLPRETAVHAAPHVVVLDAWLGAIGLIVVAPLAFPLVWPEIDADRQLVNALVASDRVEPQLVPDDRAADTDRQVLIALHRLQ